MNRNKKLIAFFCAMTMIFSLFASFNVVSAAGEGLKLEVTDVAKDNTSATVVAKYEGMADGVSSAKVVFSVPSGTTAEYVSGIAGTSVTPNYDVDGQITYFVSGLTQSTKAADHADGTGTILTITLKFSPALTADAKLELLNGSLLATFDGETFEDAEYTIADNTLVGTDATVNYVADPSVTPTPTPKAAVTRPTQVPVATQDPNATSAPVKEPVEITDKGIELEVTDVADDGSTATVAAKYVGMADGVSSAKIVFSVPSGTTAEYVSGIAGTSVTPNYDVDGQITYFVSGLTQSTKATDHADGTGTILTITLKFAPALTENFDLELLNGSLLATFDGETFEDAEYTVANGDIPAYWTTIEVESGSEEPTPTPATKTTLKLGEIISNGVQAALDKENGAKNDNLYVTVQVEPASAVYGKDYVAVYNGKTLTEAEYNNLIWGYTDDKISDVINGLSFVIYSGSTVTAIKAQLNDAESNTIIAEGTGLVDTKATPKPNAPAITVTGTSSGKTTTKVTVGKNITLTAKISNVPAGVEGEWSYEISTTDAEKYLEPLTEKLTSEGAYQVKFEALAVKSSVPVTFKYTNTATDEVIATKEVKVQVAKETTTSGGSGNSSGSGSGSIAYGSTGLNNGTGNINFVDLDTVTWAQDAILALVEKGVINGRSNTIFDPNGTVTRAEFAKMVVLGFGLTGGAEGTFSDVDYTEWYAQYVMIGYANDVISGYDDGTFRPNGLITRQEMAAMIARAIKAANKTLPETVAAAAFEDAWQIGDWAIESVTMLQKGGVINGMTETTYEPLSNATRAQAAVIIYRAITKAL